MDSHGNLWKLILEVAAPSYHQSAFRTDIATRDRFRISRQAWRTLDDRYLGIVRPLTGDDVARGQSWFPACGDDSIHGRISAAILRTCRPTSDAVA